MTSSKLSADVESMLRVDLAGEAGAQRIYAGQLAALQGHPEAMRILPIIQHMAHQEDHHYTTFAQMCREHRVRPTVMSPLWDVAGYALGYLTGKLGVKAAMACTVAVEEVIDQHYTQQIHALQSQKSLTEQCSGHNLHTTLEQFRQEELDHKATALDHGAQQAPGYPVLRAFIGGATRLAIAISKRV